MIFVNIGKRLGAYRVLWWILARADWEGQVPAMRVRPECHFSPTPTNRQLGNRREARYASDLAGRVSVMASPGWTPDHVSALAALSEPTERRGLVGLKAWP